VTGTQYLENGGPPYGSGSPTKANGDIVVFNERLDLHKRTYPGYFKEDTNLNDDKNQNTFIVV